MGASGGNITVRDRTHHRTHGYQLRKTIARYRNRVTYFGAFLTQSPSTELNVRHTTSKRAHHPRPTPNETLSSGSAIRKITGRPLSVSRIQAQVNQGT